MKRIGIFSFYDKDGVVGDYIDYLLKDLTHCLHTLVIVVNGKVNRDGYAMFQKYTDKILIRENKGYDAGAYKEAIFNYIGVNAIRNYNQLILVNDTFFGPFIAFEKILSKIAPLDADFWGMNYVENNITNHIQSYFLVFNQSIIMDDFIFQYVKDGIDENTLNINDVYACFEVGLFSYLVSKGYQFRAYTDKNYCDIYTSSNYFIKEYGLPLMKKKCFAPQGLRTENIMDALRYIDQNFEYDINFILREAKRKYGFEKTKGEVLGYSAPPFDEEHIAVAKISSNELKDFLIYNTSIYIYGTGSIAKRIAVLYAAYFQNLKGFVVSDHKDITTNQVAGYEVAHISDVERPGTSIIVALNREYTMEVMCQLEGFKNVLTFW